MNDTPLTTFVSVCCYDIMTLAIIWAIAQVVSIIVIATHA